jgi:hypothetical protein
LREEQMTGDERLREEQMTGDERLREEQMTGDERLRAFRDTPPMSPSLRTCRGRILGCKGRLGLKLTM